MIIVCVSLAFGILSGLVRIPILGGGAHEFGGGSNDIRMYHAHVDALLLDAVYYNFQRRELCQRVCATHGDAQTHLALRVGEALQNSRGTAVPRERSQRRPRAA